MPNHSQVACRADKPAKTTGTATVFETVAVPVLRIGKLWLSRFSGQCGDAAANSGSRTGNHDRPTMDPVGVTDMPSAAGTLGSPGIVMMSPVLHTTKPAPADP